MNDRRFSSLSPTASIRSSSHAVIFGSSLPTSTLSTGNAFSVVEEPTPKRTSFVHSLFRRMNTNRNLSQSSNGDINTLCGPKHGDLLQIDGLGDVEMTDGHRVTLRQLVDISVGGIVLFMYPKISALESKFVEASSSMNLDSSLDSPLKLCIGAKQAQLFRDSYQALRVMGYSVYGLSNDAPQANYRRKLKHNLPFGFLCDQHRTLIQALGFKGPRKGTIRGIIAINKEGRVLLSMSGSADGVIEAACAQLSLCV